MSCYGTIGPIALGECGPKSSLSVKTTSSVTNNLTESLKSLQSQNSNTVIMQDQTVDFKNAARCCKPFKVKQGLTAIIVDTSKMTATFKSQTQNKIVSDIKNSLQQSADTKMGLLATPAGANLKTAIENTLNSMVTSNKIADIVASKVTNSLAKQSQKITIDCGTSPIADEITPEPSAAAKASNPELGDKGCYIDQDFVFTQTANNIMESVFNSISQNEDVKRAVAEVMQTQKTESAGLDAITGQFFGAWTNIAMMVAGVIGLVVIIGLIVVFWPGGNKSVEVLANKAVELKKGVVPGIETAISQFLRKASRGGRRS
jgi:hypothetical protein